MALQLKVRLKEGLFKMADDKKSKFSGYPGSTKYQKAKNLSDMVGSDYEDMTRGYKDFKSPKDPDVKTLKERIGKGDESAADALQRANAIGDSLVYNPKKDPSWKSIKEGAPSDIADTLQDAKNKKAAADYEKNKTYKKGGKTTAKCMARGGGIEIRGKTKGRFV